MPDADRAEATSEEQIMKLPLPRRVCLAITFASRSSCTIKPLNFSTDQRPSESDVKLKIPLIAVFEVKAPIFAWPLTVRTTSRLISAMISVERMFASSVSASKPWIAFRS